MILAAAAALATSWAQVAPSEEAALARTPDGALHVAYVRDGGLFHVNPSTGATTPVGAAAVRPALVAAPDGLRVYTDTLVRLMEEIGVDPEEAREALRLDKFAEDVREDEALAQQFGIQGVPFFVFDRKYGLSGAQPPETMLAALERAWEEAVNLQA